MKIGIDFDNTIVSYDEIFHKAAIEKSLIPKDLKASKTSVKNYLIVNGQIDNWTKLQGYVYGERMLEASIFEGLIEFLELANYKKFQVCIISHKTVYPYLGKKYNLHISANKWIDTFLKIKNKRLVSSKNIFFENTKEKKIERISLESCDIFVDDLPEIFLMKNFPDGVKKILFDPALEHKTFLQGKKCTSWNQIRYLIE